MSLQQEDLVQVTAGRDQQLEHLALGFVQFADASEESLPAETMLENSLHQDAVTEGRSLDIPNESPVEEGNDGSYVVQAVQEEKQSEVKSQPSPSVLPLNRGADLE
ncbi:MAG: hypothetical protein JSV80_00970, partial [Acidobacteriota bacterium]